YRSCFRLRFRTPHSAFRNLIFSAFAAQKSPKMSFSSIFTVPIPPPAIVHFAIAVVSVTVKSFTVGRINFYELVDDLERFDDKRVVGGFDDEANKLEKTGV